MKQLEKLGFSSVGDGEIYDRPRAVKRNFDIFDALGKLVNPQIILEIGSWEGSSAVSWANSCKESNVICVDTWLGSVEHYQDKLSGTEWGRDRLYIENGFPTIFKTFISNIRINKIQDRVYPVTIDSKQAFIMLKESGIKPDICYIDAAHDYESVISDLKWAKKIGSKVICGDDYYYNQNGNQIKRAVDEFCLYNNMRAVTKDDQFVIIDNFGKDIYSTLIQRGWHDC